MLFVCLHINIYLRDFSVISAHHAVGLHSALRVACMVYFAFSVRFGAAVVQFYTVLDFTFC